MKWINSQKDIKLLKLHQEKIEILNITTKEIELVIKKFPQRSPWTEGYTGEFYQMFNGML